MSKPKQKSSRSARSAANLGNGYRSWSQEHVDTVTGTPQPMGRAEWRWDLLIKREVPLDAKDILKEFNNRRGNR